MKSKKSQITNIDNFDLELIRKKRFTELSKEELKIFLMLPEFKDFLDQMKTLQVNLNSSFQELSDLCNVEYLNPLKNLQESIQDVTIDFSQAFMGIKNSLRQIKGIKNSGELIQNLIKLPTSPNEFNYSVTISSIKALSGYEYNLQAESKISEQHKIITYEEYRSMQWKIHSLQNEIKIKDEVIEKIGLQSKELEKYYLSGGSPVIAVTQINYDKSSCTLKVMGQNIQISSNTKQGALCQILFSRKKIDKRWELEDIVAALGEDSSHLRSWIKRVSDTVRHLNDKVHKQTGQGKFIVFEKLIVYVNPKYLN